MCRKDRQLRSGSAGCAETNEGGLGPPEGVNTGFATKVSRRRRRGRSASTELAEGLLQQLLQHSSVNSLTEHSNVARRKGGLGERLDVFVRDVRVCGAEDGVAQAGAECEGVGELNGMRCGVGEGGSALRLTGWRNPLSELIARELGRGKETGENVDKESP